jgi:hypothetical protein
VGGGDDDAGRQAAVAVALWVSAGTRVWLSVGFLGARVAFG